MITINCTNCRALLEMDDAFAGGVCRCQHCGTIQTVPKHLRSGENGQGQPVAGHAAAAGSKPLYRMAPHGGTGLDELSAAVASSGLARSALRRGGTTGTASASTAESIIPPGVNYATPAAHRRSNKPLIIGLIAAGVLLLLVLAGAGYWLIGARSTSTVVVNRGGGGGGSITDPDVEPTVVVPKTPHFLGLDLSNAQRVVYVLDRGSATGDMFDPMLASAYRSVDSLGPGKQFAIILWDTETPSPSYPESGLADATNDSVVQAMKAFDVMTGFGSSDPTGAIRKAAERQPTDVVFVTGKSDDLPEDLVATIDQAFGGKAKVHAIALREDFGETMKQIAAKTGGSYKVVKRPELDRFSLGR